MAKYKITKQQLVELKEKMINLPPLVKKALVGEPINTPDEAQQGVLIYETPDAVKRSDDYLLAHWSSDDAIAFGFEYGKAYIGYNNELFFDSIKVSDEIKSKLDKFKWQDVERMTTHAGVADFYNFLYGEDPMRYLSPHRSAFGYTGRLWVDKKIISFWQYPDKEKLPQLIKMLRTEINNVYGVDVNFSDFKIEIKRNEYVADLNVDDEDYIPDVDWEKSRISGNLIPIKDFISSNDATEQEMQAIHLLPSDEKKNTPQMQAARDANADRLANKFNGNVSQAEWNNAKKKYQGEAKKIKITSSQLNEIKNYLLKENEHSGKLKYIGNCVEADDIQFCPLFSSGAEMAHWVGDPDNNDYGESIEITEKQFFDNVELIPNNINTENAQYFYIEDKLNTTYQNAKYFYIYDDNGIHWFFERKFGNNNLTETVENNINKLYHASRSPIDNITSYSDYKKEKSGYYEGMFFYNDLKQYQNYFNHQKYTKDKYYFYEIPVGDLNLYNLEDADKLKDEARKGGFPANNGSGYYESRFLDSIGYDGIKNRTEIILFHPENFEFKLISSPEMNEDITIPVTTGDTVMMGKFKNKRTVVKTIDKDTHGMPTINGRQATTFRTVNKTTIKENPDRVTPAIRWDNTDALSFGIYNNKMYISYCSNLIWDSIKISHADKSHINDLGRGSIQFLKSHGGIKKFNTILFGDNVDITTERELFKYPGRVWLNDKIISFWEYPKKEELIDVLSELSNEINNVYGVHINFNGFFIENGDDKENKLISINDYVGGNDYINGNIHLLPSDEKVKTPQMKAALDAKYKHIGDKLGNVTQAEYNHYKRYGMGESIVNEEQKNDLLLYHGTKHNFLKFETTNIGGGEGNQSFGWGIYFTDNKSVSEFYANLLGGDNGIVYTINVNNGNFMSWYGKLEKSFCGKLASNMIQNGITELPINRMLNNGKVEVNKLPTKEAIEYYPNGKFLYENLALALGGDKMASNKLNELGVDGVYYPIGQFLKKGDKSHANGTNYVIFSEDKINIIKKEKVNNINELNENVLLGEDFDPTNINFKFSKTEDNYSIRAFENDTLIGSIESEDISQDYYEYEFEDVWTEDELEGIFPEYNICKINYLTVNPEYQKSGVAKKLLTMLLDKKRKDGFKQFYLNASPMGFNGLNINSLVEFYKKFGFKSLLNQGNNVLMGISVGGIVTEAIEDDNNELSNTKIVDNNGNPLKVYRAQKDNRTQGVDRSSKHKGIYFSADKNSVKIYGDKVKEYFLNIENPIILKDLEWNLSVIPEYLYNKLIRDGYDGAIWLRNGVMYEIVAFYENQVIPINNNMNEAILRFSNNINNFDFLIGKDIGIQGIYLSRTPTGERRFKFKEWATIKKVEKVGDVYKLEVINKRGGVISLIKNINSTSNVIWNLDYKNKSNSQMIITPIVWDCLKEIDKKNNLTEATESDVNLSSFKPKKELNEKFWVNNRLKPIVRKRLLKIADDFIDFLKVDIKKVEDILFLGSLANYNWSSYSDVDLHLLVDFETINKDVELVRDYFETKKKVWNEEHDNLKIFGFPIEVYVQDKNDENASVGVFSLEKNKWLTKPEVIDDKDFDKKKIKEKAAAIMTDIDDLLSKYKKKPSFNELNIISNKVKKLYDKIKKMRKVGLASEKGETSVGNIVFKVLRRNGYMEKLVDLKTLTYDKINSIK